MTPEEKQLLLKDLCARLPYEVKVLCFGRVQMLVEFSYGLFGVEEEFGDTIGIEIENIKPYFRSISNMTEEETKTYKSLQDSACSYHYEFGDIVDDILYFDNDVSLDYLNSIHVDYRGLIEKSLAIVAPEGMYES